MVLNNDGKVVAPEGENAPKLVEVEIGDKKVMVSEEGKELLMTQADYTRKTQALAQEKKELEEMTKQSKDQVQTAQEVLGALANNEKAAKVVEALLAGDESKLGDIVGKSEDVDDMSQLKKKFEQLEQRESVRLMNENQTEIKKRQYVEAKVSVKEKFGVNLDDYYPKMEAIGRSEKKNVYEPWFLQAAIDDIMKAAQEQGLELGRKEALGELTNKTYGSPIISSGQGTSNDKGIKNTREAAKAALNDIFDRKSAGA